MSVNGIGSVLSYDFQPLIAEVTANVYTDDEGSNWIIWRNGPAKSSDEWKADEVAEHIEATRREAEAFGLTNLTGTRVLEAGFQFKADAGVENPNYDIINGMLGLENIYSAAMKVD